MGVAALGTATSSKVQTSGRESRRHAVPTMDLVGCERYAAHLNRVTEERH